MKPSISFNNLSARRRRLYGVMSTGGVSKALSSPSVEPSSSVVVASTSVVRYGWHLLIGKEYEDGRATRLISPHGLLVVSSAKQANTTEYVVGNFQ